MYTCNHKSLYILSGPWFFCGCWAHCRRCGSCCADIDHRCSSNSSGSSREGEENTKSVSALSTQLREKFHCHVIFRFDSNSWNFFPLDSSEN